MQVRNNPRFVLSLLVIVFFLVLGLALYAPAYVTTSSPQNSHILQVVQVSYFHPATVINKGMSANFSNYYSHYCVYHD
jgi:hypothetical protein